MKRTGHPKREDGYTMIFNELLEALMCADIPKRARRLIDVQMRFSFGCGPKSFTSLTKSEFASLADLDWSDTHRALGWLLENRIFERDETDGKRYRLNKYYSHWLVRVGLRDRPGYGDRLARMVKSHLAPSCEASEPSGETPDEPPGKSAEPSGETPDGHLAKHQTGCVDSSLETEGYDLVKKRVKKRLERNEDIGSSYTNQGSDDPVAGPAPSPVPDNHPFFAPLIGDPAFWNALAAAYPDQNLPVQVRRMTAWLMANPKRRPKDYKRFIQGWLAREERKETAHGREYPKKSRRDRDDPEEEPPPFSDFPPELVIR